MCYPTRTSWPVHRDDEEKCANEERIKVMKKVDAGSKERIRDYEKDDKRKQYDVGAAYLFGPN